MRWGEFAMMGPCRAPVRLIMDSAMAGPTNKGRSDGPNRFTYSDVEVVRILAMSDTDNSFLSTTTPNMLKRKWEGEHKKLI